MRIWIFLNLATTKNGWWTKPTMIRHLTTICNRRWTKREWKRNVDRKTRNLNVELVCEYTYIDYVSIFQPHCTNFLVQHSGVGLKTKMKYSSINVQVLKRGWEELEVLTVVPCVDKHSLLEGAWFIIGIIYVRMKPLYISEIISYTPINFSDLSIKWNW